MAIFSSDQALEKWQTFVKPLCGTAEDYDHLIDLIGDARFVMLGEATHGTHEFYHARAEISKRLIVEKGFTVIAWEADWPDALRTNRYIRGGNQDANANEALNGFKRFPTWMWRNADIVEFVEWLRNHNSQLPRNQAKPGIYGLDLYSLHSSIESVIGYLEKVDHAAAVEARRRYSCFEEFGDDPQAYGRFAGLHYWMSCEDEVVRQFVELQKHAADYLSRDGRIAADDLFYAEQNALVAKNAEQYYRAMYHGRPSTWNLRDTHMADTLEHLTEHLEKQGERPKVIAWAHNSHLGDARATQMSARGELNVGQLMRERHGRDAVLVGFTTYQGTVTAASEWGGPAERKIVRPGMNQSYEQLFHELDIPAFLLAIRGNPDAGDGLSSERLERAIGVIYRPETERWSHYFNANLSNQFDAVIHFDKTRAVEPLERNSEWEKSELPETYPSGM